MIVAELLGWLVVLAVWCALSLFLFLAAVLLLFGEGELTVNGHTRKWQGIYNPGKEMQVIQSHCDQCGEYIDKRVGHGDGHWVHTATGSQYCILTMTNGVADGWSPEACEPCGIEGCQSNEEWEEAK